jgi:hypothetical protein
MTQTTKTSPGAHTSVEEVLFLTQMYVERSAETDISDALAQAFFDCQAAGAPAHPGSYFYMFSACAGNVERWADNADKDDVLSMLSLAIELVSHTKHKEGKQSNE